MNKTLIVTLVILFVIALSLLVAVETNASSASRPQPDGFWKRLATITKINSALAKAKKIDCYPAWGSFLMALRRYDSGYEGAATWNWYRRGIRELQACRSVR